MRHRSRLLVSTGLIAGLLLVAVVRADDDETPYFVMEVTQLLRGPAPPALESRRAALLEQIEKTRTDSKRQRLERALESLDERIERSRSFVLDGWSSPSTKDGRVSTTRRSQRGVLVESDTRSRSVLDDFERGLMVVVEREADLFTNEGRRYTRGVVVRTVDPPDGWRPTNVTMPVPDEPDPDGAPGVEVGIGSLSARPDDVGTLYRTWLRFEAPPNPDAGRVLQLWLHVTVQTAEGTVIGPLPVDAEFVDRDGEGIVLSRSWELHRLDHGPAIDRSSATVEVVASRWSRRMSH